MFVRRWSSGVAKLLLTGVTVVGLTAMAAPSANAAEYGIVYANSPGETRDRAINYCYQRKYSNTSIFATGTATGDDGKTYFYSRFRCS